MTEVRVEHGDCRTVVAKLADTSIDSVVTDPPYALVSIAKRFGADGAAPAKGGVYARAAAGFMGKKWDTGEVAFDPAFWADVLRLIKPGGHVVAFGGTRTYHRLACAIEDAGFEIRDQIGWLYGSGFPKSHDAGDGWGTALKPAWEPIVLARKPLIGTVAANVLAHGTGAINIDGCRVEGEGNRTFLERSAGSRSRENYRTGTASRSTPTDLGRWPANIVHDGSDEVVRAFPRARSAGDYPSEGLGTGSGVTYAPQKPQGPLYADSGSAARFFYSAKADSGDRLGSKHPTVKPVDLMAWLCRLVTPPGGTVLDPFAGSGSTGMACLREGFGAILVEREGEYVADIRRRLAHVEGGDTPLFAGSK